MTDPEAVAEAALDEAVSALALDLAGPGWDPLRVEAWLLARFGLPGLAAVAAAEVVERRRRCRHRPSPRP